jgi:GNAT superfamily N-acetyltransferase
MIIKTCEPEDIEPCAKLFAEVYSEPPYNEAWDSSDAITYLARFREIDPDRCFIAKENNKVVGAIFSFSYPWHSKKTICIQELFVSPEHRRKGIGRQLLFKINHGQRIGAWLVAHRESDAAEFYEKMGFSQKGPYEFRHGVIGT